MADGGASARIDELRAGSIACNAMGDQATSTDSLGFTPYVEAIARFLTSEATRPPITISIEGEWGSGKSSFLLQLENAIVGKGNKISLSARLPEWLGGLGAAVGQMKPEKASRDGPLSIRFNAWRHDKQDALWAAFALAFVKSLREEVGPLRAWRGDILLFLKRLKGPREWLELAFLLVCATALLASAGALCWVVVTRHDEIKPLLDWLLKAEPKSVGGVKSAEAPNASALRWLASSGTFGSIAALGLAGLSKFRSAIKASLSMKLEKYIAKPDYEGHVSFIENFHVDLNRLVEAYAGDRRVFIFIDDLDRCDVPRAADLMQAINLMIGDAKNLIFIMGMDREKVAAGIAQKYKDILPFLRDSAHWKPNDEKDDYTPLYFGYGYLEKFIQISFTLPVATSATAIESFFHKPQVVVPEPRWAARLWAYWVGHVERLWKSRQAEPESAEGPATQVELQPSVEALKRTANRLLIEDDSDRIRRVVGSVAAVFEHNPRRIKQFINTFRLALYIASDQGLFDQEGDKEPDATPEQIGKFVALLLRFPDLRFVLEQDGQLLRKLQEAALAAPDQRPIAYHWLSKPGAIQLLTSGCHPDAPLKEYSLANFDIGRLFSVLPRAAVPPAASNAPTIPAAVVAAFRNLAREYEAIRARDPSGSARTRKMTGLAQRAIREAQALASPAELLALLTPSDEPGERLMRILIAYAHTDPANLSWLHQLNRNFLSAFEHYWCIQTLLGYLDVMSEEDRIRVNRDLSANWDAIADDPGRAGSAKRLLDASVSSTSQAPPRSNGATRVKMTGSSGSAGKSARPKVPPEQGQKQ